MLEDLDSLFILATVQQILWRLLKTKDHEPEEENQHGDCAEGEEEISPPVVRGFGATEMACRDLAARLRVSSTGMERNEAISNR